MKRENLEQTLINSITDYVIGAINNDFVEEEMISVKENVYIAPAADEDKPWGEQGCEVTWKDSEGNAVQKAYLTLGSFADDFGDLIMNGRTYVEDIAREIYKEVFEENMA